MGEWCHPAKVGVVSSSIYRCPPTSYGSEATTWDVADVLGRRGHEVHLFAPPGSRCPPNGVLHPIPLYHSLVSIVHEMRTIEMYKDLLLSMDVIHDASATCRVSDWLRWYQGRDNFIAVRNGIDATYPLCGRNVVGLSAAQARILTTEAIPYRLSEMRHVHYGVDTTFYNPHVQFVGAKEGLPEQYFLFLSRPHPHKGVDTFIQLARECPGEQFVMAWRAEAPDHKRWEQEFFAMAGGLANLHYVELPNDEYHHLHKAALYAHARALVLPLALDYVEAFGLVFIESLACGTPVITAAHGACPEVVDHARTGFLCRSFEHYLTALRNVDVIDRGECRRDAERRWSRERMVNDYITLYGEVLQGRGWGG